MFEKKFLALYANVLPVKGYSRSLLIDMQDGNQYLIPNYIFNMLSLRFIDSEYINNLEISVREATMLWVEFLKERKLVYYTNNPELYPLLDLSFNQPSICSNIIIELSKENYNTIMSGINREVLISLGCKAAVLNLYDVTYEQVLNYIDIILNTLVDTLELMIDAKNTNIDHEKIVEFSQNHPKIKSIIFYNHTLKNDSRQLPDLHLSYVTSNDIFKLCGTIVLNKENINLKLFSESQNHNTCLNKKISVDRYGDIRNCPKMPYSAGNIKNMKLKDAIAIPKLKQYWNINKDSIAICKDCEFRHICIDCRAFTERTDISFDDIDLSKPLKCGYDPYNNIWEEWSNNPLKKQAISYYNLQDLIKPNAKKVS